MKILVCISHVPDTTSKISFVDDNSKFDKEGVQFIIGPYDDYALARAVELKEALEAQITVLNVGLAETEQTLRKALAIGADNAIRIDTEPYDSMLVATQIAAYAKGYDLIMMGRESIDYNSGVVHNMVGEMLGMPAVSPVTKLDVEADGKVLMQREIDGGKETVEAILPLVVGCQEPIAEWKIPTMRGIMSARTKSLEVIKAVAFDRCVKSQQYTLPASKGQVKMIDENNVAELARLLKHEEKII